MSEKKCATELFTFNKKPGRLKGLAFGEEHGIQARKMQRKYEVLSVKGFVKWKVHGSGEPAVSLKLKRGRFDMTRTLLQVELAKRGGTNDGEEFVDDFEIYPSRGNVFWVPGDAGEALMF